MSKAESFKKIEVVKSRKIPGETFTSVDIFEDKIKNVNDRGWSFNTGDPEMWKFQDRLFVPNGQLLDLGISTGRGSFFFALQGMNVTGYDVGMYCKDLIQPLADGHSLPIQLHEEDFSKADLGKEKYDTILIGQSLVHFFSKNDAFEVLDRAVKALKPDGHLWLRGTSKLSSHYDELIHRKMYSLGTENVDDEGLKDFCLCSGEPKMEPILFLDPVETMAFFTTKDMNIIHSQVTPENYRMNVMYGEDWPAPVFGQEGAITILAQKSSQK